MFICVGLLLGFARLPISRPDEDFQNKGIIFNFHKKIIVSEKFEKIQFLLPFPTIEPSIEAYIIKILDDFDQVWEVNPEGCDLRGTNMTSSKLSSSWLKQELLREKSQLNEDLQALHSELFTLFPTSPDIELPRAKRGLGTVVATAAAATGILGLGMGRALSNVCVFGIFGSCSELPEKNKKAIASAVRHMHNMSYEWQRITETTNDEFFLIKSELRQLTSIQKELHQVQQKNAQIIEDEFKRLEENLHLFISCQQYMYAREQANYDMTILSTMLNTIYTTFKVYRATLYAFRSNVLAAQGTMANGLLPMTLIPKHILQEIILEFKSSRNTDDRLTPAIPYHRVLSYYETPLLQKVITTREGLLFEMSIPYASSTTDFEVYHAIPIPMPIPKTRKATIWKLETNFLAVSENANAILTEKDLAHCLGSKHYAICTKHFATEVTQKSCLASLYFNDAMEATQDCTLLPYELPSSEKAMNLGHGRWLITSATTNFKLRETRTNTSDYGAKRHPGCQSCIILLGCGQQLRGDNIHIRADLESCLNEPPTTVNMTLPTPLQTLFNELPAIELLPHMPNEDSARAQLLEEAQIELKRLPRNTEPTVQTIQEIARPIVNRMKNLRPELNQKFEQTVDKQTYFIIAILSFLVSILAHFIFTYCWGLQIHVHKRFPFVSTMEGRKIRTRPLAIVSQDDFDYVTRHPEHKVHDNSILINERILKDILALHSSSAGPLLAELPNYQRPTAPTLATSTTAQRIYPANSEMISTASTLPTQYQQQIRL